MLLADPRVWGSSRLHGHRLWQQYLCYRPVVATPQKRLNGSNVSESVSSKAVGHRQQQLLRGTPGDRISSSRTA
jgi:hypothetical protein